MRERFRSASPEEKKRAYAAYHRALRRGQLVRPEVCERCLEGGGRRGIVGHHADYSRPLDIIWVCQPCHDEIHRPKQWRHYFVARLACREEYISWVWGPGNYRSWLPVSSAFSARRISSSPALYDNGVSAAAIPRELALASSQPCPDELIPEPLLSVRDMLRVVPAAALDALREAAKHPPTRRRAAA